MPGIREFVIRAVEGLEEPALRQVCSTLRLKVHPSFGREDVTRIIGDLVARDRDTSLGAFIAWIDCYNHKPLSKNSSDEIFFHAYLPTLSPRKEGIERESTRIEKDDVKLEDDVIASLKKIDQLEETFKHIEREIHFGSPNYEKMKSYMLNLTKLRNSEEDCRKLLLEKNKRLVKETEQLRHQENHTRAQLEFFVEGYSKLRKRHDDLIDRSSRLSALDETCQDLYMLMFPTESQFGQLVTNTLQVERRAHQLTKDGLFRANETIHSLYASIDNEKENLLVEKHKRQDAQKDAGCSRLQLRRCKKKYAQIAEHSKDIDLIRSHLSLLRKEMQANSATLRKSALAALAADKMPAHRKALESIRRLNANSTIDLAKIQLNEFAKYVWPNWSKHDQLSEIVHGIILTGSAHCGRSTQAKELSVNIGHIAIDVHAVLAEANRIEHKLNDDNGIDETTDVQFNNDEEVLAPEVEFNAKTLAIRLQADDCQLNGWILYAWTFSKQQVDELLKEGCRVDQVLSLALTDAALDRRLQAVQNTDLNAIEIMEKKSGPKVAASDYTKDHTYEHSLYGLGTLFCRIDADDSRQAVAHRIQDQIEIRKRRKLSPYMKWNTDIRQTEEINMMFLEDIASKFMPALEIKQKPTKGKALLRRGKTGITAAASSKKLSVKSGSSTNVANRKSKSPAKKKKTN